MENQIYILIMISLAFLIFMGIFIIMAKKNVFTSTNSILKKNINLNYFDKYYELKKTVGKLKDDLEIYQIQNESLTVKIEELENSIEELDRQRILLLDNKLKLENLQREKDDFVVTVVHDIKNPASAIQGFVKLLESYDLTTQEQQTIMEGLLNTSNRIVRLVEDVTKVFEAERNISETQFANSQINKIIDTVCSRYSGVIKAKNLVLTVKKDNDLPLSMFDENKIDHVLDNLVNNAIKFSPPETEIQIRSYLENNNIVVEVKDDGYGLSQDELSKAFEKGRKLSTRPTGGESSSGLGLWIVKRIIEEHKGRVWVKSTKGYGSTFAFKIPVKQEKILELA